MNTRWLLHGNAVLCVCCAAAGDDREVVADGQEVAADREGAVDDLELAPITKRRPMTAAR